MQNRNDLIARGIPQYHTGPFMVVSINLLSIYHECHPLIGFATHVLFCDR